MRHLPFSFVHILNVFQGRIQETQKEGARPLDPEYPKLRTDANKESRMAPISWADIY